MEYPYFDRKYIFQGSIFYCYVSLPKCISNINHNDTPRNMQKSHPNNSTIRIQTPPDRLNPIAQKTIDGLI